MYRKKCKCEKTEKNFFFDIGPFFVDECCMEAGYDDLGNKKEEAPKVEERPESAPPAEPEKKLGKGKLNDMKVAELKELAKSKGIEGSEGMTKKQLVEALLK